MSARMTTAAIGMPVKSVVCKLAPAPCRFVAAKREKHRIRYALAFVTFELSAPAVFAVGRCMTVQPPPVAVVAMLPTTCASSVVILQALPEFRSHQCPRWHPNAPPGNDARNRSSNEPIQPLQSAAPEAQPTKRRPPNADLKNDRRCAHALAPRRVLLILALRRTFGVLRSEVAPFRFRRVLPITAYCDSFTSPRAADEAQNSVRQRRLVRPCVCSRPHTPWHNRAMPCRRD